MIVVVPWWPVVPDITLPVALILAAERLLLLHVPFGDPLSLSSVLFPPVHNGVLPDIAAGVPFTEKVRVAAGAQPSL